MRNIPHAQAKRPRQPSDVTPPPPPRNNVSSNSTNNLPPPPPPRSTPPTNTTVLSQGDLIASDADLLRLIPTLGVYKDLLDLERKIDSACHRRAIQLSELMPSSMTDTQHQNTEEYNVIASYRWSGSSVTVTLHLNPTTTSHPGGVGGAGGGFSTFVRQVVLRHIGGTVAATWSNTNNNLSPSPSTNTIHFENIVLPPVATNSAAELIVEIHPETTPRQYVLIHPQIAEVIQLPVGTVTTIASLMKHMARVLKTQPQTGGGGGGRGGDITSVTALASSPATAVQPLTEINLRNIPLLSDAIGSPVVTLSQLLRFVSSEKCVRDVDPSLTASLTLHRGQTVSPNTLLGTVQFKTITDNHNNNNSIGSRTATALRLYQQHTESLQCLDDQLDRLHRKLLENKQRQRLFADFATDPTLCMHKVLVAQTQQLGESYNPVTAEPLTDVMTQGQLEESIKRYIQNRAAH